MNKELQILQVIDTLKVGPVKIEKNRLLMPYSITTNSHTDTFELIYKYEEYVFNPANPEDKNLAAMIGAQVAFNYGLFCNTIQFDGIFDKFDQSFIKEMIDNTSREIYVKKFLEPNPFLIGEATKVPVIKLNSYTNAKIEFNNDNIPDIKSKTRWNSDISKVAILSSGGKDSLLSFGLMNEIKYDVHPIFINESGRHWYTALNSYRHLKSNHQNTTKVWTNSDRLFSWMLRHLKFIRKDFANVRSDEYPIRLWTVAVFLFGALPLLNKRQIGRIIIGDEYDTSVKKSYKGISHYDGLYDQSRYFDMGLTRYFAKKHWQVKQFSILRPLSEMLIENILVKRYPDLQRNQVSCHATHIVDDRVLPCGKCEKCRRIIGMLTAIDADPKNCGYTQNQIDTGLNNLLSKRVHQEAAGSQHLLYILKEKGLVIGLKKVKPHPEILKIRVDPERSPVSDIPTEMRHPLYKIFLEHANGSIKKSGRMWIDFDLLNDNSIHEPFIFETTKMKEKTIMSEKKEIIFWEN